MGRRFGVPSSWSEVLGPGSNTLKSQFHFLEQPLWYVDNREHDESPEPSRVNHRLAGSVCPKDVFRNFVRLGAEQARKIQVLGHSSRDKSGLDSKDSHSGLGETAPEAGKIGR